MTRRSPRRAAALPGLPQRAAVDRALRRGGGREAPAPRPDRRARCRLPRARHRRPHRPSGGRALHVRHRGRELPPGRARGRPRGRAADRAHRRPAARAARGRRRPGHRPAPALRRRGPLLRRAGRRRAPCRAELVLAQPDLPGLERRLRRVAQRAGAPEHPVPRAAGARPGEDGEWYESLEGRPDGPGGPSCPTSARCRRSWCPRRATAWSSPATPASGGQRVGRAARLAGGLGDRRPRAVRRHGDLVRRVAARRRGVHQQAQAGAGALPRPADGVPADPERALGRRRRGPAGAPDSDWPAPAHNVRQVGQWFDEPTKPADPEWLASWQPRRRGGRGGGPRALAEEPWPSGLRVASELVDALPEDSLLVVGSSNPTRDVALAGRLRPDVLVHRNRGVAGIDGTVSTAIGAATSTGARRTRCWAT